MDSDTMKNATDAAGEAAKHGTWFAEAFAAAGATIAGFIAARRLRRLPAAFDDEHPLIQVIRDEGKANREELREHKTLLHSISTDIAILKDRRP
jgi:hypothetical protein